MIAFKVETTYLQSNFYNYFDFEFENWTWDYSLDDYADRVFFEAEPCTENHFSPENRESFNLSNLQTAYCLPLDYEATIQKTENI